MAVLVLSGCASLDQPEVERVASAFGRPGGNPADQCALVAPTTVAALEHDEQAPCAEALTQLGLPGGELVSVAVWGDNAQAKLTNDTLFLNRTGQGWQVVAAGCQPQGEDPYLCRMEP